MNNSLFLDIHSLITIHAPELSVEVANYLSKRLGLFEVFEPPETASITLVAIPENDKFTLSDSLIYNFWLTEYQGEQAIAFTYRGEAVIAIVLSENLKILYRPVKNIAEKLYTLLLYCIHLLLVRQNGLLFHGALAVSKDKNQRVILTGPRSSKKTLLLLNLLRDGWHYVSDDKFILSNQTAYMFQSDTILCEHHLNSLPWLLPLHPDILRLKRWTGIKKGLKKLAIQYLPGYLHQPLEHHYNNTIKLPIADLFPNSEIIDTVKPNGIVILSFGLEMEVKHITVSDSVSDISNIQSLAFYKFYQFEKILSLLEPSYSINLSQLISNNLIDQECFKLTIPYNYDIGQAYKELKTCLDAV